MATRATDKKNSTDKPKISNVLILKALPLELLTPEEYEVVTKAIITITR